MSDKPITINRGCGETWEINFEKMSFVAGQNEYTYEYKLLRDCNTWKWKHNRINTLDSNYWHNISPSMQYAIQKAFEMWVMRKVLE